MCALSKSRVLDAIGLVAIAISAGRSWLRYGLSWCSKNTCECLGYFAKQKCVVRPNFLVRRSLDLSLKVTFLTLFVEKVNPLTRLQKLIRADDSGQGFWLSKNSCSSGIGSAREIYDF
jgi:hypothetical protein